MNKVVLEWYFDQTASYFGLILSIVLFIIITKKLNCNDNSSPKLAFSLKFWIYAVYGTYIILFLFTCLVTMILILVPSSSDEFYICKCVSIGSQIAFGLSQIAIVNLFIERLRISFQSTLYAISSCTNYVFRIGFIMLVFITNLFAAFTIDSSPFNIDKNQIALNGEGETCSAVVSEKKLTFGFIIAVIGNILCILIGNITVWTLFLRKLSNLIKQSDRKSDELIILMKEQTMIVSIAASSTLFFWLLTASNLFGQFFVIIDFIINISVIFVSFKFNRFYFQFYKCDKLALFCCKCYDKKLNNNQSKLAEIVEIDQKKTDIVPELTKHPSLKTGVEAKSLSISLID